MAAVSIQHPHDKQLRKRKKTDSTSYDKVHKNGHSHFQFVEMRSNKKRKLNKEDENIHFKSIKNNNRVIKHEKHANRTRTPEIRGQQAPSHIDFQHGDTIFNNGNTSGKNKNVKLNDNCNENNENLETKNKLNAAPSSVIDNHCNENDKQNKEAENENGQEDEFVKQITEIWNKHHIIFSNEVQRTKSRLDLICQTEKSSPDVDVHHQDDKNNNNNNNNVDSNHKNNTNNINDDDNKTKHSSLCDFGEKEIENLLNNHQLVPLSSNPKSPSESKKNRNSIHIRQQRQQYQKIQLIDRSKNVKVLNRIKNYQATNKSNMKQNNFQNEKIRRMSYVCLLFVMMCCFILIFKCYYNL